VYASDVVKAVQAPILHMNDDDPEAYICAVRLAFAFRSEFAKDVVIDMWCYRRWGHNEEDEPSFMQPLMYRRIGDRVDRSTGEALALGPLLVDGVTVRLTRHRRRGSFSLHKHEAGRARRPSARARTEPLPSFTRTGRWRGFERTEPPRELSQSCWRVPVS
jgi:2-oxoglutarate dehydrogenase complex dehydrogenase (E1) component-like enzyme